MTVLGDATSFNGQSIIYDAIGNPTTYKGNDLAWTYVRRLASYGTNTFEYGADGIRTKKNNITYVLDGNKILRETDGASRNITYYYGTNGVVGFNYNGTDYYYRKNLQGDVIEIYSSDGTIAAQYFYDAWGKVTTVDRSAENIGTLNPFRYRSYYYDTETGLYYLNSRYYDPEVGRFINADDVQYLDPETLGGLSLYAYCLDNPVNMTDENGNFALPNWAKWFIGGVVIAGLAIATIATGGAAGGVAGFILAGALKGAVIGAASGALVSGALGGISATIAGDGFWNGFATGAANGFMYGAIIGGITGAISSGVQVYNASKLWANTGNMTSYRQMVEHYQRHVIKEGQKAIAKNIVKYSKDAYQFFNNNCMNAQVINAQLGVVKIAGAPGGIYNLNGLIRSFWYIPK